MVDLNEKINQIIKVNKPEDEKAFRQSLVKQLAYNNYYGIRPVMDSGKILIYDEDWLKIERKFSDYCQYFGADTNQKYRYLEALMEKELPDTHKIFRHYIKAKHIDKDIAFDLLDFLLYYLPGELVSLDDREIGFLMDDVFDNLSKAHGDYIADFINWTRRKYKTYYYRDYFVSKHSDASPASEAYSPDEYLHMLYVLFNEKYIEDNDFYLKAAESRNFVDTWLFLSLHFICALRNTDLFRFPHPRLTMPPDAVLEQVKEGTFSKEDARLTLHTLVWHLNTIKLRPNKTKKVDGISPIKFFVPESIEVHIGKLFAIAEAHHQVAHISKEEPLIRNISSYEQISKYMGDEVGEIFLESNFRSRSANKSFMQMIYFLTDDVLEHDNEFNVKGYILAALARSHKGNYGEFAKTTSIYLKDAKMNGYTPEFVAKELFERGVLSFIPSMLLKMVTNGEFQNLSPENQTKMIKQLDLSAAEVENVVAFSQKTMKRSTTLVRDIYTHLSIEEVLKCLHNLANGEGVSKEDDCSCLLTAMRKFCPYPDRKGCIGCQYEIHTKSTMFLMLAEYKRLKGLYEQAKDPVLRGKYRTLIVSAVLPAIDEMIKCIEEIYGKDAVASLEKMVEETQYAC